MRYHEGDIVAWYEYYACGTICRDAGIGIVVSGDSRENHEIYRVLKGEKIAVFSGKELESYEKFVSRQQSNQPAQENC